MSNSSLNKAPRLFQLAGYLYAKMNKLEDDEDFASDGPQFPFYPANTADLAEAQGERRSVARGAIQ